MSRNLSFPRMTLLIGPQSFTTALWVTSRIIIRQSGSSFMLNRQTNTDLDLEFLLFEFFLHVCKERERRVSGDINPAHWTFKCLHLIDRTQFFDEIHSV